MKIACLQLAPSIGKLDENIAKADDLLKDVQAGDLDLLVLPEMAFTGYNFPSLAAIEPYLEPTSSGRTTRWAITTAKRLDCNVTVGYPETVATEPRKHYNTLVTVSRSGEILASYRKSFLYYTDETWATEGVAGFYNGPLGDLGNACMGICMDINPYRFQSSYTAYEFATHCVAAKTPLVVLSMAWLTTLEPQDLLGQASEPDLDTLSYWLGRFVPLLEADHVDEVTVVFANRCGLEPGSVAGVTRGVDNQGESVVGYAGSSCVMSVKAGEVRLFDIAGRAEEILLVVDTLKPAKFALAKRNVTE